MITEQDVKDIQSVISGISSPAKLLLPQYAAFIALGEVVAKVAPQLYLDVVKMISKAEPTAEEVNGLMKKVDALFEPEKL